LSSFTGKQHQVAVVCGRIGGNVVALCRTYDVYDRLTDGPAGGRESRVSRPNQLAAVHRLQLCRRQTTNRPGRKAARLLRCQPRYR